MKIFTTIASGDCATWRDSKLRMPRVAPGVGVAAVPGVPAQGSVFTLTLGTPFPDSGSLTFGGFNTGLPTLVVNSNNGQDITPILQSAFAARFPGITVSSGPSANTSRPGAYDFVFNYPSSIVFPDFPNLNSTLATDTDGPIFTEWELTSNYVPPVAAVAAQPAGPFFVYAIRGATVLDLVAADIGSEYETTLTLAQSKTLKPGLYSFQSYLTDSLTDPTVRYTISKGQFTVTPDLTKAAAGFDGRSQAEKDLESVRAAIRTVSAGGAIQSYMIAGRSVQYRSLSDLITLESKLAYQVQREKKADMIKNGLGNPFASFVRFK